jgi:hypothetical protein
MARPTFLLAAAACLAVSAAGCSRSDQTSADAAASGDAANATVTPSGQPSAAPEQASAPTPRSDVDRPPPTGPR